MRIYHLAKKAKERGSYTIKFTFKDHYNLEVNSGNINSLYWWLSDLQGRIINGRSRVTASIENPFYLTLQDEDLQITNKALAENKRIVTVRGDYNSDLGLGLPFSYSVSFDVQNLLIVDIDLNISVIDPVYVRESVDV